MNQRLVLDRRSSWVCEVNTRCRAFGPVQISAIRKSCDCRKVWSMYVKLQVLWLRWSELGSISVGLSS
ncbi:hypothetical protein DPMN_160770 [Dreissena polymorpha]|uniref:Uncharacterized protein n=1 Tax=Dreissena polymorpha TaxID=45954 RepID=A0A9D4ERS8_DREPO|nr:hypothetical protein DPMN_160770 [Dreissena polymorpha]